MENKISDAEILRNVMDALGPISVKKFTEKLNFASHTTIYKVLKGETPKISVDMRQRILNQFPNVSYLYLTRGKGEPLVSGSGRNTQNNMLNRNEGDSENSLQAFLDMPGQIKELLDGMKKLQSDLDKIKEKINNK